MELGIDLTLLGAQSLNEKLISIKVWISGIIFYFLYQGAFCSMIIFENYNLWRFIDGLPSHSVLRDFLVTGEVKYLRRASMGNCPLRTLSRILITDICSSLAIIISCIRSQITSFFTE